MLDLIVDRLLPDGSAITIVIDDTLFKRAGRKVFGMFWHDDGAAKGPKPVGFGNCWGRRCVVEPADVLNPPRVGGQIAWASSMNAAATRRAGGTSSPSS
jgi:hypothetical protein